MSCVSKDAAKHPSTGVLSARRVRARAREGRCCRGRRQGLRSRLCRKLHYRKGMVSEGYN